MTSVLEILFVRVFCPFIVRLVSVAVTCSSVSEEREGTTAFEYDGFFQSHHQRT